MTRRGFTMIEALVVIALMGTMSVMATAMLSSATARTDGTRWAAEAVSALRDAQAAAMSGRGNARFGVHFEAARFVVFQGASYNPADSSNLVHELSGSVAVTAVSLSPGGSCALPAGTGNCDVHFASRKGVPVEVGTIAFTGADGVVRTVTVNAAGMVDVN